MTKLDRLESALKRAIVDSRNANRTYRNTLRYINRLKRAISSETYKVAIAKYRARTKFRYVQLRKTLGQGLFYKWTTRTGCAPHANNGFKYNLPKGRPGDWHREWSYTSMCNTGYHVTKNPLDWQPNVGGRLFVVQGRGRGTTQDDKTVFKNIRFIREIKKSSPEYKSLLRIS